MGYRFNNSYLLKQALTHKSITEKNYMSYERLEFLGDAVLELVVSEYLYEKFPKKSEGFLTKTRSSLVNANTLYELAVNLNIYEFCIVDKGLELSNTPTQTKLLSNFVEAIIGAIYLDRGYKKARHFIKKWIINKNDINSIKQFNYKGQLIELCQKSKYKLPRFSVQSVTGPDHERKYTIDVIINDEVMGTGQARTKLGAEQEAAEKALKFMTK
jgi:ribonuclease-3